jgi:ferredoxin-NADP reductase
VPLIRKVRCVVNRIDDHGDHVYTLELVPEKEIPKFNPGQFLHLALDTYDPSGFWPDSRAFSIASSPSDRSQLKISYSVKGKFTARMEKELRPGSSVWVKLPYGEFIVNAENDIILLAGGTGITAFASFLTNLPQDYPRQVHLFYGARKPSLLIYRSLVENAMQRCAAFRAHCFVEMASDGKECLPGRIDLESVWASVPNPLDVTYYPAGPPEMIEALTRGLERRGVDPSRIISDAWE